MTAVADADTAGVSPSGPDGRSLVVFPGDWDGPNGAFVTTSGTIDRTLTSAPWAGSLDPPSVAGDGRGNHLVVWNYRSDGACEEGTTVIDGAIVTPAGAVSRWFEIAFPAGCDSPEDRTPRVGFDGTNYFVVWSRIDWAPLCHCALRQAIRGARVTPDGEVLDFNGVELAVADDRSSSYHQRAYPRLAFDGTSFLVVYSAHLDEGAHAISATRVDTTAGPIGLGGLVPIARVAGGSSADVVFDGENWVVAWTEPGRVAAARVSRAGAVLDATPAAVATDSDGDRDTPTMAFDGSGILLAWGDESSRALVFTFGLSGPDVLVAPFELPLQGVAVAPADGHFLAVGEACPEHGGTVRGGIRISPSGDLLEATPFLFEVCADTTPPVASITSSPPRSSPSSDATFEFTSNESGSTFACRLDNGPWAPCTSPMSYSGLHGCGATCSATTGAHSFRVRPTDAAGNVGWDAVFSWLVDVVAPTAPALVAPANGTSTLDRTPTFDWSDVSSGGVRYRIEADDGGSGFATPEIQQEGPLGGASMFTPSNDLPAGTYAWRVRAIDHAQNVGPWSVVFTVTVGDTTPPGSPALVAPANGASISDRTPTFDWRDVVDQTGVTYRIQIDDSGSGFTSPEAQAGGLSASTFTPSASLPPGTYAWRVGATDGEGNKGPWSETFTVTIQPDSTVEDVTGTRLPVGDGSPVMPAPPDPHLE